MLSYWWFFFFFQAEDGIRDVAVTGVQTCALPIAADTSGDAEAEQLRQQIRERWNARVRQDLNLSDDQAAKLQGTEQKFTQQRVELAQRQRTVNEALRGQLQPGVAANSDSVRRLMDARDRNRAALAEIDRNENREVSGYLTPMQQARYQMMREQLRRRIQEIREQRRRRSEMMGPRRAPGRPHEAKPPRRRP